MAGRKKNLRVNRPTTDVDGIPDPAPSKRTRAPNTPVATNPNESIPDFESLFGSIGPEQTEQLIRSHASPLQDSFIEREAEAEAERLTQYEMSRLWELAAELARREVESLNLYEPMQFQAEYHASPAHERCVRGGNRSGKSTCTFVEDARCVTNQDPYKRYPEKGGKLILVGYDQDHIGKVIYPTLFGWGAFLIIPDEYTGDWRAFRPWEKWDQDNRHLSRPAPPLIPKRFIKGKPVWVNKGEHVFSVIRLTTGWEINAYSSRAKPPQGFKADRYHIDEDIDNEEIVDEIHARISTSTSGYRGYFDWSALPHSRNTALLNMSKRAAEAKRNEEENPDIVEFVARFDANPHIDEEAKLKTIRAWQWRGSDVARMRNAGEFTMDEFLVFPEFSRLQHGVPLDSEEVDGTRLPADWCRFAVIDPGYTTAAVLFAAVPPPSFGNFLYLEDELYIGHCTADKLAQEVRKKIEGFSYYAFIIDKHGSVRTEANGKSIKKQYEEAFEKHGVRSETTGSGFVFGSDNKQARIMSVHDALRPRGELPPRLRYLYQKMPNLEGEAEHYVKKRVPDPTDSSRKITVDEPDDRGHNHLMHCLQYLCHARGVYYHEPQKTSGANDIRAQRGWTKQYLAEKRKKRRRMERDSEYVNLGPES